ncbi:MAG TPA: aromatic acid exporter family protein [Clostridia bacterium]
MKKIKKAWKYLSTHGLGYRTLKTMLAIAVCLTIAYFSSYNDAYFISSVALLTMHITPQESIVFGIQRLIGTFLGGLIGAGTLYLSIAANIHPYILTVLAVGFGILICNLIRLKNASAICALVVMLILIAPFDDLPPYAYVIKRTLETAIGILIAVMVNFSFKRNSLNSKKAYIFDRD